MPEEKKEKIGEPKVQGTAMPGSISDIMQQAHAEMQEEESEKHNPEQVDRDLAHLLEGGRVTRSIKIGKKVITLRSLSKMDAMHVHNVATVRNNKGEIKRDENGMPFIDSDVMGKAYCAIGISEVAGVDLPDLPDNIDKQEDLDRYLKAYQERAQYINKLPDVIVNKILVELQKLHRYIDKISEVSVVENF